MSLASARFFGFLLAALPFFPSLSFAQAPQAGSIVEIGDTLVSAMMMFVGSESTVYILDKVENNAQRISNHPAWASSWDLASNKATLMDIATNTFCAAGGSQPNGTWAVFGGNKAVGPGCDPKGGPCAYDGTYGDNDGARAVRLLSPDLKGSGATNWQDNGSLQMARERWYPGIETLADGTFVLLGGFTNGGYINRNYPDNSKDPDTQDGANEPTYEFWPPRGDAQTMDFMTTPRTGGLNSYAHMYLMLSGKMLVQANVSTIMWDVDTNEQTQLPDMPNGVVRVYPASGAVAMLPLTPENNYTPTILFCGGQNIPDDQWGNYVCPIADVTKLRASQDCQRLTPEPSDGTNVAYEQDDDMIEGRTMGQFIILPDETLLVINGARNGTAGYSNVTGRGSNYTPNQWGMSLASEPTLTPAIYDPSKPKGSRWSNSGLGQSQIPRLYHSSAVLLPDASVMLAGSNPNVDVNLSAIYSTTYKAEKFYPPYFSSSIRPTFSGIPSSLTYGGNTFDLTVPFASIPNSLSPNAAAAFTRVVVIRPGFSTHALNMGQKLLRLNTTYTVQDSGDITLHCSQMPPNANVYQPGPAFVYVVIDGIPSEGKLVIVGSGSMGKQDTLSVVDLPSSTNSTSDKATSSTSSSGNNNNSTGNTSGAGEIKVGLGSIGLLGLGLTLVL